MLFSKALDRFEDYMVGADFSKGTIITYMRAMHLFRKHLEERSNGPVYLEDVTEDKIEAFLRNLKDVKGYTPNSRSRFHYTLKSFYRFACRKGLVMKNLADTMEPVKLPQKERDYLNEAEVAQLVAEIPSTLLKLVVEFLFNTGLRISECLNLTLQAVDLERKVIHVWAGKGNKDRLVPINDKLYTLLKDYLDNWRDAYDSERFFATRKTGSLSQVYINHEIRAASKRLGWRKRVSCHVLRHSFASTLVQKNVGLVQIQKLLGHSSLAVTSVYTHTSLDQLKTAVNAL
jgi:integrase/recombinase XerD